MNLECPVVVHNGTPIEKCGPNLKATVKGSRCVEMDRFQLRFYSEQPLL